MFLEIPNIGVAGEEPEKLVQDGLQMHLLGGDQWETLPEVKPHLMAENAGRAGTCSILPSKLLRPKAIGCHGGQYPLC